MLVTVMILLYIINDEGKRCYAKATNSKLKSHISQLTSK